MHRCTFNQLIIWYNFVITVFVFARGERDDVFDSWSLYLEWTVWFVFPHPWISRAVPFSVKMITRELIRYIRMRCSAERLRWTFRSRGLDNSDFSSRWSAGKALFSFPSASRSFLAPWRAYGLFCLYSGKCEPCSMLVKSIDNWPGGRGFMASRGR